MAGSFLGIGNDAVDVQFGVEHGDSWGAGIIWIVKLLTACCHSDAMSLGLLGADVADEIGIGDFSTLWNLSLVDEKYGAGAFDSLVDWSIDTDAVGKESAPFVGETFGPSCCGGAEEKLFKGALFASRRW